MAGLVKFSNSLLSQDRVKDRARGRAWARGRARERTYIHIYIGCGCLKKKFSIADPLCCLKIGGANQKTTWISSIFFTLFIWIYLKAAAPSSTNFLKLFLNISAAFPHIYLGSLPLLGEKNLVTLPPPTYKSTGDIYPSLSKIIDLSLLK